MTRLLPVEALMAEQVPAILWPGADYPQRAMHLWGAGWRPLQRLMWSDRQGHTQLYWWRPPLGAIHRGIYDVETAAEMELAVHGSWSKLWTVRELLFTSSARKLMEDVEPLALELP